MTVREPDFTIVNGGSIALLTPETELAEAWVGAHIGQDNGFQPYWPTVALEASYMQDIIDGIEADGLTVE